MTTYENINMKGSGDFSSGNNRNESFYANRISQLTTNIPAKIQTAGSIGESTRKPEFYLFTAGNFDLIQDLARELSVEFPVYGLLAEETYSADTLLNRSIHETAVIGAEEVRRVQPNGPYYLFGWSFGGYVVYEIARILVQQGEIVKFLGMVDTRSAALPRFKEKLTSYQKWRFFRSTVLRTLEFIFNNLEKGPMERRLEFLRTGHQKWWEESSAVDENKADPWFDSPAIQSYVPEVFDGTMCFFWGQRGKDPLKFRLLYGWEYLVKRGVELYTTPGDHKTMIREPYCRDLATRMRAIIRRNRDFRPSSKPLVEEKKSPYDL